MPPEKPVKNPTNSQRYRYVRDRMKPGDVIAFSGDLLVSRLNRWVTRSPYSHVALVTEIVDSGGVTRKDVLIIEAAAPQTKYDPMGRKVTFGVQVHWLSKRLDLYQGRAWWVPLHTPLPSDQLIEMQTWLNQIYDEQRPFDLVQVVSAGVGWLQQLGLGKRDYSALYCAELATAALQIAGAVDPVINASRQTPDDVVKLPCFEYPMLIKSQ